MDQRLQALITGYCSCRGAGFSSQHPHQSSTATSLFWMIPHSVLCEGTCVHVEHTTSQRYTYANT